MTPLMKTRLLVFFGLFIFTFQNVSAQLDTKHYIPPFYAKPGPNSGTSNMQKHFVSLSTPATDTIPVIIKDGFENVIDTVEISRDLPVEYVFSPIGNASTDTYPLNVIPTDSLNLKIRSQGLYFSSYQPFFVNMRHKSGSQGTSLTSKGRTALGKRFYSGHIYTRYNTTSNQNEWNNERRSHFISVMATEDNTVVLFDKIKAPIHFIGHPGQDPFSVTLDAFESYTIGIDHSEFDNSSINLANGTRITSNKPIACNSGSWLAGNEQGQCIGSDQLVPAEVTGQEYILVRGLGDESTEHPIVIATEDNTDVYINDETAPVATIDEGEFYIVPTEDFTANGNLYILATEKVFVYQTLSGSSGNIGPTVGLSFIPPLNCIGAKEVNLPFVNSLAAGNGQGRINIITKAGTSIYVNGSSTPIGGSQTVTGNADWVTYAFDPPSDNVIIESDSVMNVALLTRDNNVGTAGYFSGFTLEPVVGLSSGVSGTLPCIPGNAVLQVFGFDTYQWYFNGEEIAGATNNTLFPEFSGDYMVEGIDLTCGFRFPSNDFSIPFCPSTLGAAKQVQNVEETSPGSKIFDVTYRIYIENLAGSASQNIQVMENINGGLPVGATAQLVGTPTIVFGALTGGLNSAFDGDAVKQLLPGSGSLPGSAADAIELTIQVDMNAAEQDGYFNQVTVTSRDGETNNGVDGPFNGQDFSQAGSNPDLNGNGEPNEEGENEPTLTCFFDNEITYDEVSFCESDDEQIVSINGVSSGVFESDDDGLNLDPLNGTITPVGSVPGTYEITFSVDGRCPTETTTEVTIVATPDPGTSISNPEACIDGESVALGDFLDNEDEGGVWTNTSNEEIPSEFEPDVPGDFDFTYTVTSEPCAAQSQTITVNVMAPPNPGTPVDDPKVCISDGTTDLSAYLDDEQGGGQWFDADGNPVANEVSLDAPGMVQYTYTVSNSACGDRSVQLELEIIAAPDAGTSVGEATICAGENLNLMDFLVEPDLDGNWTDDNGDPTEDEIVISETGNYVYTYTVDRAPCESVSSEVIFDVQQGPSAGDPDNPELICISDPVFNLFDLMDGGTPGGDWTDGDGNDVDGIFDPQTAGNYEFIYTVTSPECGDIESELTLNVSEENCISDVIRIPQGFSPNGDGIGDQWIIETIGQYPNNTVKVFNRWGAEIFSASPYENDWGGKSGNGLNSGEVLPVGTYYYIIDPGDGSDVRKGYVYLTR